MARTPKLKAALGCQFAALPFKQQAGETLVMLVTSRDTGRWVLPKGWAEKRLSGAQLAAKEAYEEAGIVGEPANKPIGSYRYSKQLPKGRVLDCVVKVFPIHVTEVLDSWPEADQRRRDWFTPEEAATLVDESELTAMLAALDRSTPLMTN